MAVELTEENVVAYTQKVGDDTIELAAGQRLQIRSGTAGDPEVNLDYQAPEGGATATIFVRITEPSE